MFRHFGKISVLLLPAAVLCPVCLTGAAKALPIYVQPSDFPAGNAYASQNDTTPGGYGAFATMFENFTIPDSAILTSIQWTGQIFDKSPSAISNFEIKFYSDNSGAPGNIIYSQIFSGNANESFLGNNANGTAYTYYQALSPALPIQGNTPYWLSIVPSMPIPPTSTSPQWGWYTSTVGDDLSYQLLFGTTSPIQANLAFSVNGDSRANPVPGPLPAVGAFAAFAYSRTLRKRMKAS